MIALALLAPIAVGFALYAVVLLVHRVLRKRAWRRQGPWGKFR